MCQALTELIEDGKQEGIKPTESYHLYSLEEQLCVPDISDASDLETDCHRICLTGAEEARADMSGTHSVT